MDIDGAKILVTGGAGLIGSTTIDLLLSKYDPARIVVVDDLVRGSLANLEQSLKDPRLTFIQGDICNIDTVRRVTEGMDAVVHLAALRITACAADTRRAMEVMCDGSFNVVDAAREAGVNKIVAASSASVYGLADYFFRSAPVLGTMWSRVGGVAAHPDNAYRLLREQQQLVLVFPEGTKGPSKLYRDRYQLRRFGRGGFVEIADLCLDATE